MKLSACLPDSAWHTWQRAGAAWRAEHPSDDASAAARAFANLPGWPEIGVDARYRAFLEGASS